MKTTSEILFEDGDLPVLVLPRRSSFAAVRDERSRAVHEAVELKLFYEGSSRLVIGGETLHAEVGDTVLVNPYEFHTTIDCDGCDGKYHLVMLGLDIFDGLGDRGVDLKELFFARGKKFKNLFKGDSRLAGLITGIVEEWESGGEASRLAIFGLVSELFAHLIRVGKSQSVSAQDLPVTRYYKVIEPALAIIRDRYSERITVEELAAACFVSKYHFCRIFKLSTGLTAIQYLNRHRLKIAEELLRRKGARIGDVAAAAGFESASYFSKLYKNHFGTSPKGESTEA